jgi:hypothetical protein
MTVSRVAILGSGSWGTAASGLLASSADEVRMWSHEEPCAQYINAHHKNPDHLVDYEMAHNVVASTDFAWVLDGAQAIIIVVPSMFVRATLRAARPHISGDIPTIVLTKGMEPTSHCTMCDIIKQEWDCVSQIAVLSGPNHAEEICLGKISAAVIASRDPAVANFFQQLFISDTFRIYVSSDVIGVELCAAVKNIVAIACGAAAGMGYGDNTLAVIMCRGLAEISRIVANLGGMPLTCMGLAGVGDLVATCTSVHSRNRSFGVAFAHGESLAEYEARTKMVVEGVRAAESIWQLCEQRGIEAPLTQCVYTILYKDAQLKQAVTWLLERKPIEEFYGLDIQH